MKTFDSYAWIEYFAGTSLGRQLRQYVEGGEALFTPSVALTEIAAAGHRKGKDPTPQIEFILDRGPIIAIDEAVALAAAGYKGDPGLHTVDALIYAAAREKETVLVTGDPHFKGLPSVEFLE
jgi:predicted nucleic acid-binding protein